MNTVLLVPVVQDQFAQVRQQVEVRVRRVGGSGQQMAPRAAIPVAFAEELTDERVRAVGLVLVDERRGLVEVLRHPVSSIRHRAAGKVGRIARSRCAAPGSTDRECSIAALSEEVEAVVEILAEGREQGAGSCRVRRQTCFLRPEDIADCARIEAREDRIDRPVAVLSGAP